MLHTTRFNNQQHKQGEIQQDLQDKLKYNLQKSWPVTVNEIYIHAYILEVKHIEKKYRTILVCLLKKQKKLMLR